MTSIIYRAEDSSPERHLLQIFNSHGHSTSYGTTTHGLEQGYDAGGGVPPASSGRFEVRALRQVAPWSSCLGASNWGGVGVCHGRCAVSMNDIDNSVCVRVYCVHLKGGRLCPGSSG